jgi:hypothetical protein
VELKIVKGHTMLSNQVKNIGSETKLVHELNNMEIHKPFRKTTFYINNTTEDVVLVHRNNLPIMVRKAPVGVIQSKYFVVRTIYKFQDSSEIVETINMISQHQKLNGDNNSELRIVKQVLTEAFNNNRTLHSCEIVLDNEIRMSILQDRNVAYNVDLDILFMYKDYKANIHHPYSAEGRTLQQFKNMGVDFNHIGSGLIIEIIDNDNKFGKRFMKLGKELINVEPREDSNKASGVYVTEFKTKDGQPTVSVVNLDMSDAEEKYGIYQTAEQAMTEDQVEQLSKQKLLIAQTNLEEMKTRNAIELEMARHETETLRAQLQKYQAELATQESTYNTRLMESKKYLAEAEARMQQNKIDHQILKDKVATKSMVMEDEFKQKSRVRDDYYDTRSADRKDKSEYVKIGAAGLIAGLGVYAAMRKYS